VVLCGISGLRFAVFGTFDLGLCDLWFGCSVLSVCFWWFCFALFGVYWLLFVLF